MDQWRLLCILEAEVTPSHVGDEPWEVKTRNEGKAGEFDHCHLRYNSLKFICFPNVDQTAVIEIMWSVLLVRIFIIKQLSHTDFNFCNFLLGALWSRAALSFMSCSNQPNRTRPKTRQRTNLETDGDPDPEEAWSRSVHLQVCWPTMTQVPVNFDERSVLLDLHCW